MTEDGEKQNGLERPCDAFKSLGDVKDGAQPSRRLRMPTGHETYDEGARVSRACLGGEHGAPGSGAAQNALRLHRQPCREGRRSKAWQSSLRRTKCEGAGVGPAMRVSEFQAACRPYKLLRASRPGRARAPPYFLQDYASRTLDASASNGRKLLDIPFASAHHLPCLFGKGLSPQALRAPLKPPRFAVLAPLSASLPPVVGGSLHLAQSGPCEMLSSSRLTVRTRAEPQVQDCRLQSPRAHDSPKQSSLIFRLMAWEVRYCSNSLMCAHAYFAPVPSHKIAGPTLATLRSRLVDKTTGSFEAECTSVATSMSLLSQEHGIRKCLTLTCWSLSRFQRP